MKILVVDDHERLGALLARVLRKLGHIPLLALHPEDALDLVADDIDAVITDIDMPGMSGVEFARAVREQFEDMPIAFCTGSEPGCKAVNDASEIGPVLHKVWTVDQMRALVTELERYRLRQTSAGVPVATAISDDSAPILTKHRQRQGDRFRTHLWVRYGTARDFVVDYAENLSRGGLFIRGAQGLEPGQDVAVELALPDAGRYRLSARVAYVLSAGAAERLERRPGAGLRIIERPQGFDDALQEYLRRLARRSQHVIFASNPDCRKAICEAGYRVAGAPPPSRLGAAIAASKAPVLAVIVSRREEPDYLVAAESLGVDEPIIGIDYIEELDDAIAALDMAM